MSDDIHTPIQYVKGVGEHTAQRLVRLGVHTVMDFLYLFPTSYDDRRHILSISKCVPETTATILATLSHLKVSKQKKLKILTASLYDRSGTIAAKWFNQAFLKKTLRSEQRLLVTGKVSYNTYTQEKEIHVTSWDPAPDARSLAQLTGTLLPIYPLVDKLTQNKMRSISNTILTTYLHQVPDPYTPAFRKLYQIITLQEAITHFHRPTTSDGFKKARYRLVFDEFFHSQLPFLIRKQTLARKQNATPLLADSPLLQSYRESLPYTLTQAQEKAFMEIQTDTQGSHPMNRMLQGDVGSGKTDIAILSLLLALQTHLKGAFLVPTSILAFQHYMKLKDRLSPFGISVFLLTGQSKTTDRRRILSALKEDQPLIIVGTHALLENPVEMNDLGLIVIDEQHRFGVNQRLRLRDKGIEPHCLFMTATPIPRSLMLTGYGELDYSILDELPAGRQPIKTYFATEKRLADVYNFCKQEMDKGQQVYLVYPLVSESEKLDIQAAVDQYETLKETTFSGYRLGLMHGKLTPDIKNVTMTAFKEKEIQLLVSTTVIEVGVDVPNATVMVIVHAERFGLSQLHQLRGRIGRGSLASSCFLVGDPKSAAARKRIKALVASQDGFEIAKQDLAIRGPGELLGTMQSGRPVFQLANLVGDEDILVKARQAATAVVKIDPSLEKHPIIRENLKSSRYRHYETLLN